MSKIIDCDPSNGFVAFPVALFDLDLTPGAFRTLAELCRMANTSGQCWPSLAQLGKRLGRSRAAISGYIAELRAAGVLRTEEQKMANGYNYRLRYTVTFWKEWRADLSRGQKQPTKQPAQIAERRVQPDERPLRTKNHIHKKQQKVSFSPDLVTEWKQAVGAAPYPEFTSWPTEALLQRTEAATDLVGQIKAPISADIAKALREFADECKTDYVSDSDVQHIAQLVHSHAMLDGVLNTLREQWQPHWKQPPNAYQIGRIIKNLPQTHCVETETKLLKSYLRRWKLHQRSLPSLAIRSKVAA